ncbi:transcription factor GTE [Salix suchowensis]|nr:transcription factor GTE [Salix suchowensis]
MASAVLANRNEPNWTQPQPQQRGVGAKFMSKIPFSNPKPKFSKKRQFQPPQQPQVLDADESPSPASDDASSINRRPQNNHQDFNTGGYLKFNVGSRSKKELIELKNRLVQELEKIQELKNRIESSEFQIRQPPNFIYKKQTSTNKKASGNKRPFPAPSSFNNLKRSNTENEQLMKNCSQILSKLMKHKLGYIFNSPVDVAGMQLHDYYDIIKTPMDLGTVKSKLTKNFYESPRDFAADVRLTFNNAMKYNPKGHEVYTLAEQFLTRFGDLYRPIKEKASEDFEEENDQAQEVQASSWDHIRREPERADQIDDDFMQVTEKSDPIGQQMHQQPPQQPIGLNQNPNLVRTPSPLRVPQVKPLKQPKPKAKDPNKREMSLEEKHKLGVGLQSLPQEKMEQVVQIIRKRNGHLRQEGDEIELDIEAVDTETLWELDRLVTNYKKMVSKVKRQALMGINNNVGAIATSEGNNKDVPGNDRMEVANESKKPKRGDVGDEDVDIGDEMPVSSFPPVEIEKDNGHASSSSSSSSSSSDDSSSSSGIAPFCCCGVSEFISVRKC